VGRRGRTEFRWGDKREGVGRALIGRLADKSAHHMRTVEYIWTVEYTDTVEHTWTVKHRRQP
jgi:hypothetical protein